MDFRDVDDLNLDGNRVNRNYVRRDQKMVVMMDASRGLHMNDLLDDHSMDDGLMKGGNLYRRMNVMDDRNDLMMVVNLLNRNCALRDLNTGASLDVSRGHHMNGLLDDQNLDVNRDRHMNVTDDRNDLKMGGTTDVSRGHRMNDLLDDLNLDAMTDVNLYRHTNGRLDDRNLDVSRVIRNCVRRDLMTDGNLDVNRDRHMNVTDDRNDLMMVVNLVNRNCVRHDRRMDVNLDAMSHRVMYY